MKKILLSLTLFVLAASLSAQNDSILKAIVNFGQSKSVLIANGRQLLLDSFMNDDFEKVREVREYLVTSVADDDYIAFYPAENWLLLYWTGEYNKLTGSIAAFDSAAIASFTHKIKPQEDLLYTKVRLRSVESREKLMKSVQSADLSDADRYFLCMNLDFLLSDDQAMTVTQDSLNNAADIFLEDYPGTAYEEYTRKYIRIKYIPSKWGMAFEFFSGFGISTGQLPDYYKNNVPIGVAFDIMYKRFALYLRDYIGFSKTTQDMFYSEGVWNKGSQVRVFVPEASLGYLLTDNRIFSLAPFAGISGVDFSPTEYDLNGNPDLEQFELGFSTAYTFGLNVDFKLARSGMPMVSYYGPEQAYWFLRVRYSYNIIGFEKKYSVDGNMHCITIGIGGLGRKMKRDI